MKKILLSNIVILSLILADTVKIPIPLPASSLSIENAGQLSAIEAYQDGVGIYTIQQVGETPIDNSEMNELVYKYGEDSKNAGVLVKEYVNSYGNSAEKIKALGLGKFEPIVPGDNSICNDNNAQTINDIYTNGICAGTNVEGVTCNDENSQTINDIYTNGSCIGTNVEGVTCNDNNDQTINDIYTNGICTGTNVEGQTCTDSNVETENDKYVNGICKGTTINKTCLDILNSGMSTGNGLYMIDPDGGAGSNAKIEVYCDMATDGGGWTRVSKEESTDLMTYQNFYTGDSYHVGLNKFTSFNFTKARLVFYSTSAKTQEAVFYKTITKNNIYTWFNTNDYEKDATSICTNYDMTANCTSKGFDHDYANDGISSSDGGIIMLWGADLSKYGYAKSSYHPFHTSNGSIGLCSTTGNLNNNAWQDTGGDGHWGNGLYIYLK